MRGSLSFREAEVNPVALERYRYIFKGNKDALAIVSAFRLITHIWDDLVDQDKPVSPAEINGAFWMALVVLPANPLWQALAPTLIPVLKNGILEWFASNTLEQDAVNPIAREISHICRAGAGDIFLMMAEAIGGPGWAAEHAAELKLMNSDETFAEYVKGLEGRKND